MVHLFTKAGKYLDSKFFDAGFCKEVDEKLLFSKLEEYVAELAPVKFMDIKVELFETTINGITFGLIADKKFMTVDLEPNSIISFPAPWTGFYDT